MTYTDEFSPDAARHNHIDNRTSGIIDFDTRNAWDEGEAHLEFGSGDSIELELAGANFQMDSKVGVSSGSVTLSDGEGGDQWRTDHIYATEGGSWDILEGEPGSNKYLVSDVADEDLVSEDPDSVIEEDYEEGDVVHHLRENEYAGGPAPKGQPFERRAGELVFSVLVPPDADDASDLSEQHILDRRREAIDLLDTGAPRQPNVTVPEFELYPGQSKVVPMNSWPGTTFRLWNYTILQTRFGVFGTENLKLYVTDLTGTDELESETREETVRLFFEQDGDREYIQRDFSAIDWSELAIWESEETRNSPISGGEWDDPILDIDHPSGDDTDTMYFVIENVSDDFAYSRASSLSAQITTSVELTKDV